MAEEKKITGGGRFEHERFFEQAPDAISCYSDYAQVIHTGNEILLQFYETIPGPPAIGGNISKVISRLRATITISIAHAQNIGKLLTEKSVASEVKK